MNDQSQKGGKTSKIKLDEGFKKMLRGIRKAIKAAFKASGLDKGKHHWDEDKWLEKGRTFLEDHIKLKSVKAKEVAIVVLLLYPAFGPSDNKPVNKDLEIY